MYKNILSEILNEHKDKPAVFKRNILKEYLQVICLARIYSMEKYQGKLIFYGGSCLKHCFGLNRLSEDLDFVNVSESKINKEKLAEELKEYFKKKLSLDILYKIQKFRIYFKFPVLRELNLFGASETDLLFLKLEIFEDSEIFKNSAVQVVPIFKYGKTILVRTFSLSALMATKIRAILNRKWESGKEGDENFIKVKGRDYYDLLWYLSKEIKPDLAILQEFKDISKLKKSLLGLIENLDQRSVALDLEGLIGEKDLIVDLSKNIKDILKREIDGKL